jgi:hypothetical protein
MRSSVPEEAVNQLVKAIRLPLDFREEVMPRSLVPLHVGAAQAADEALDVAQWQSQFMGCAGQKHLRR